MEFKYKMEIQKTLLFALLCIFSICNSLFAQTCFTPKSAGGVNDESGTDIATDSQGNIYAVGFFRSASITFGSQTLINKGVVFGTIDKNPAMFIVKYNAAGVVLWAKSVNGNEISDVPKIWVAGNLITIDPTGGVIVSGEYDVEAVPFNNSNPISITNKFIAKYDDLGNIIWVKSYPRKDLNWIEFNSISADTNGNIMTTGSFFGSVMFGTTTLTSPEKNQGVFIVKYNSSGTVLWAKSAKSDYLAEGSDVASDLQGNHYLIGNYGGGLSPTITFDNITLLGDKSGSGFVVKYSSSGNVIWAKRIWGDSSEYNNSATAGFNSILVDVNGDIILTGTAVSGINFDAFHVNDAYVNFLMKINNVGDLIYFKIASRGSSYSNYQWLSQGKISTNSTGDIYLIDQGAILKKFSGSGDLLWDKYVFEYGEKHVSSLCTDLNDNTYITGKFYHNLNIGNITLTSSGGLDFFIARAFDLTYINSTLTCKGSNTGTAFVQIASGIGTYNYLWSDGQISPIATGLSQGIYSVIVTDSKKCKVNPSVTIYSKSINPLSISTTQKDESCINGGNNGEISIQVTGGVPEYNYLWNTIPSQSTSTITNLKAGNYQVSVTDFSGCVEKSDITINYTPNPSSFSYTTNGMVARFSINNSACSTFVWDFGNGNTSTINRNPIVTYASAGTYGVCLQCNNQPSSCVQCIDITVPSITSGTTLGIQDVKKLSRISIYPNPSYDNVTIENSDALLGNFYSIIDTSGRVVAVGILATSYGIDVSKLSKGVYIIRIGNNYKSKFIKE